MSKRMMAALALLICGGLLAALVSAGFLGRVHPAFDSLAHFRLHLAALLGVASLALLATRFRREGFAGLVLAAASFVVTPGTYANGLIQSAAHADASAADEPVYRLLQFNARFDNPRPRAFLSLVGRMRPDIITMQEVSAVWAPRIEALRATYPHRVICEARGRIGGVAILSRRPFVAGTEPQCLDRGDLAVAAVDLAGRPINVASLHLHWPWPYGQAAQVRSLEEPLAELGDAAILAGDFNAVRWSETVRAVSRASGLADAGPVGPSWLPYELPLSLRPAIGLGIDHVLSGSRIAKLSLSRADDAGSDHLPVLFEFALAPEDEKRTATTDIAIAPPPAWD